MNVKFISMVSISIDNLLDSCKKKVITEIKYENILFLLVKHSNGYQFLGENS